MKVFGQNNISFEALELTHILSTGHISDMLHICVQLESAVQCMQKAVWLRIKCYCSNTATRLTWRQPHHSKNHSGNGPRTTANVLRRETWEERQLLHQRQTHQGTYHTECSVITNLLERVAQKEPKAGTHLKKEDFTTRHPQLPQSEQIGDTL